MPFTARIFRLLESELNKNLMFSFSILENVTRPGSRQIRVDDRFLVRVTVRNQCSLTLKNVRGTIQPTSVANFPLMRFDVPTLAAHREVEVARIEARIVEAVTDRSVFDRIATVNVAGQADLSDFWFRDTSRALPYAQPTVGVTTASTGGPRTARRAARSAAVSAAESTNARNRAGQPRRGSWLEAFSPRRLRGAAGKP